MEAYLIELKPARIDRNTAPNKLVIFEEKLSELRLLYKSAPFSDSQVASIKNLKDSAEYLRTRKLKPPVSEAERKKQLLEAMTHIQSREPSTIEKEAYGGLYSSTDGQ
jgi:hypothetical protein